MSAAVTTTSTTSSASAIPEATTLGQRALRRLLRDRHVIVCFSIIAVYVGIAACGYLGILADFQQRIGGSYDRPELSLLKFLGTDVFGRSVFLKILAGTQTAMTLGFVVTIIEIPIGVALGAIAGYYGGRIDGFIVWLYSVIVSVPYILLLVAISFVLGKGLLSICLAMGLVDWVGICRLIRGEVMRQKDLDYVSASRLLGASDRVLIFRHILPNVMHLAINTASLSVLGAIKAEVILTYIGVGVQTGASWGAMISDAPGELVNGIWWPLVGVVVAMFLIVYALNVAGDALRDALDPKIL